MRVWTRSGQSHGNEREDRKNVKLNEIAKGRKSRGTAKGELVLATNKSQKRFAQQP